MTIVTQNEQIARSEEVLSILCDAIRDLRQEITGLTKEAQSTGELNEAATKQSLSKLKDMVFLCLKAESYLNDCKSKQAGIAQGGYALDLDGARVEIGCKLDRLRRCGRPRPVPE